MAASITEHSEKVVFQCDLTGNLRRIHKVSYMIFETQLNNQAFQVDLMIRMKASFAKSKADLIKNDHMIFQKRGSAYFLLFEADKERFRKESGQGEVFEETSSASPYDYRIMIRKNDSPTVEKESPGPAEGPDAALARINSMLEEHGITKAGESSPVDEFMKSWKLGHPDEK